MEHPQKRSLLIYFVFLIPAWRRALLNSAYKYFSNTKHYERLHAFGGYKFSVDIFIKNWIVEYSTLALTKNWLRVIFAPWTIDFHSDISSYGMELIKQNERP